MILVSTGFFFSFLDYNEIKQNLITREIENIKRPSYHFLKIMLNVLSLLFSLYIVMCLFFYTRGCHNLQTVLRWGFFVSHL